MASTSRTPDRSSSPPQWEAQPSSSAAEGICLPFDEAINQLPEFMQPKDEREHDELEMFLSQVDELHKPGGLDASATSIFNYIQRVLESDPEDAGEGASQQGILTRSEAFERLPEIPVPLSTITGDISTEIASNVIDKVDPQNITISVMNKLQRYSWEAKVALTITTYILTFGNYGLNLCADSKFTLDKMPMFVKQLLEITSCIVEFEKLPKVYMTLPDPKVKEARTHFVVAVYWIIKAVVANSASHIIKISTRGFNKFDKAISSSRDEKLEAIANHLKTKLLLLQELLEDKLDMEVYNKIKEIVKLQDHSDNLEVLKALISSSYDVPQLYDGFARKKVHLNELEDKYVLLLLTDESINDKEISVINQIHVSLKEKFNNYELVTFPIVDPSLQRRTYTQKNKYQKLRSEMKCIVEDPRMIRKEVIKFFTDDWNFKGEPIIVVLDPRGKVVNQNAIPMMYIWLDEAFPFTRTREETLWKEQTWSLDLLIDSIEPLFYEWMSGGKYIFMFGGINLEWIRSLIRKLNHVSDSMQIAMEKFYAVKSGDEKLVSRIAGAFQFELFKSPTLRGPMLTWFFWTRIESMIHSMVQHGKFDVLFQDIQRLHNYDKYNTDWVILAKGSEILLIEKGDVVLSTLEQHELWQEKAHKEGFEVGFMSHYQQHYYRRERCDQHILLPTAALNDLHISDKAMLCPDCKAHMKPKYITFVCDRPSWKS